MARIQTPQHVQELQAEFKVREPFGLELLETIQPTYALALQKVASQGYPRKCMGWILGAAGGVGTNVECALVCPSDVGIIILLESISFYHINGNISLRADDGVAMASVVGQQVTKSFRDTRINPTQQPDGILQTANPLTAAPNGREVGRASVQTTSTEVVKTDVVLGSGGYFIVRRESSNTGVDVNFMWTEFLLEDR